MLEAIKYLHNKNIVHRDLKPENILYLTPADNSNVVLADFGIAKRLESPDEKLTSSAGSFGYAAPEVILGTGHGKPCDIWSLGVITYTLLCGYSPFRSENVSDFIEEVKHNNAVIFHADYWKDVSKDARRFIIKALQFDPNNRPDAETLLNDKWLVSIASEHKELDLLPNLKENFNAKQKFKQAIEMVKLNNKIKKLKELQGDDDDDPNEINLFGDEGALISSDVSSKQGAGSEGGLGSWKALSSALNSIDDRSSAASVSSTSAPKKKSDLASDAFVQLVHAATNNKERVANYKEGDNSSAN
jgi:calcium/calmodulin-dependent protein kinase I